MPLSPIPVRSLRIDLGQPSTDLLEALKAELDASGYPEVIRAALRALRREIPRTRPAPALADYTLPRPVMTTGRQPRKHI